jgi:uncharacterized protein (DUF2147 family)
MIRSAIMAIATLTLSATIAHADPIEGNWKTQSGETAAIGSCGSSFCITLKTGKHKGKRIGKIAPQGAGAYAGSITDPANDKTYSGKATLAGSSLKMSGCVLGGLICRSQSWSRM